MANKEFQIKVGVNSNGVLRGIDSAVGQVQRLTAAFDPLQKSFNAIRSGMIGTAVFGAFHFLAGTLRESTQRVRDLKDGMAETALTADEWQRVNNVMQSIGKTSDAAAKVMESLASGIEKARAGNVQLIKDFAELGISLDDLNRKNRKQVFFQLADTLKFMDLNDRRLNALQSVGGGKAPDLMPAFRKGFEGQEANANTLSDEDIEKLEKISQMSREIENIWRGIKTEILLAFAGLPSPMGWAMGKGMKLSMPKEDPAQIERQKALQQQLDDTKRERAKIQAAKAEAAAEKQKKAAIEKSNPMRPDTNALSRLGLHRGGQADGHIVIQRQQYDETRRQTKELIEANKLLKETLKVDQEAKQLLRETLGEFGIVLGTR